MRDVRTVVVGSRELLTPLEVKPGVGAGAIRVFPPDDIRAALEAILDSHPTYLVLDHEFSESSRGTAMIDRLKADPGFEATEVLVVRDGKVAPLGAGTQAAAQSLDGRGTRRVPRIRIRPGVDVQVDGNPAQLIDLSTLGAQVVSVAGLKPNQRIRISLPSDHALRMAATVAWANFELPKGRPQPQYRAGLEFSNADPTRLVQFCVDFALTDADSR